MATLQDIIQRAEALKEETALNSISPDRAGGIMYDTLIYINQMQLQESNPLLISKIYASVAAMEADSAPVSDLTGRALVPGQVVVIASSDSDNGSVYRYNGIEGGVSSWTAVGKIGNLEPVDSLDSDSTQLPLAAHQGKVLDGKISHMQQEIGDTFDVTSAITTQGVVLSTGATVDSAYYRLTDFIPVTSGQIIRFRTAVSSGAFGVSAYSLNNAESIIVDSPASVLGGHDSSTLEDYQIVIPNGVNYIRICRDSRVVASDTITLTYVVSGLTKDVELLKQEIGDTSDVTSAITTQGVVLSTGATVDSAYYRLTDFIPVTSGQIIRFRTAVSSGAFGVSAYSLNNAESIIVDSPASVLGGHDSSTLEDYQIVIPNGVNYIRICRDSRVVASDTITLTYVVSGLTKDVELLKAQTTQVEGDVDTLQNFVNNIDNHFSILASPQTQPRKGFVAWCMDCGVNFFYDESKAYDAKLSAAGYKKSTYAVLPGDLSDVAKKNFIKFFYDLGREMVIHSDSRIYDANTEALYEQLVQTYFDEMHDGGVIPAGGWISLGGATVPYMSMLKKYIGWGQTGPKNYDIINDEEYLLGVNTLQTDPAHLMRLYIEQSPEQVTTEITNKIITRAREVIDLAANNGSYIVFYTHSYNRPTAVYTLYDAVFDPILSYIKEKHEKGQINIGAIGDMVNFYYAKRFDE